MARGAAIVDIDRYGADLAEHLRETIDRSPGGIEPAHIDAAAYQLVWRHYMVTGQPHFGRVVAGSLQAICRSWHGETQQGMTLADSALLLELLTWVWRQIRCHELRRCAEGIATRVIERMRVRGRGFANRLLGDDPDHGVPADGNGLILVALVEAGSVFERRDWLALTREVFEELVAHVFNGAALRLDDYAAMSRAAVRLFEAFGKPRYLELAEAWVATLGDAFSDATAGGYRVNAAQLCSPTPHPPSIMDATLQSGNALMIGVLARLYALTGRPHYAERAETLVDAFQSIIPRSGIAGATAVAGVQTLAQLVSIKVSGDPTLPETRELMRVALDYALPDRLVLGPGVGDPRDANPKARICLGTSCLAPITDVTQLRALTAPGGLSDVM